MAGYRRPHPRYRGASPGNMAGRSAKPQPPSRQEGAMRVGVLTGGGDCPGLNAVIRAIVRKGEGIYGHQIIGFRHGWRGVLDGEVVDLTLSNTRGLIHRGGTILGTSRTNPVK